GLNLAPWMRVMDQAGKNFDASEGVNFFQAYLDEGLHFYPAKRNIGFAGYDALTEALRPKPYVVGNEQILRPTLRIMRGVHHNDELAYQIKTLRYREWKGLVTDKDAPEEPEQKRRHLVDALSYVLLHGPYFVDPSARPATFTPLYQSLNY